jgi:hypothetical protein
VSNGGRSYECRATAAVFARGDFVTRNSLALVESATQLLNAVEFAHASGSIPETRIVVLAPTDGQSVRQIQATAAAVGKTGIDVTIRPVRLPRPGTVMLAAQTLRDIKRADTLIIGDPFSRFIQTMLPAARARNVVIVDDGTATWDYAVCVNEGRALTRWDNSAPSARATSTRATRLLSPSERRTIEVFTCLRRAVPCGAIEQRNDYQWTKSQWRPKVIANHIDLLGTSLVDNGIVKRRAYVDAVAALARFGRPIRYLAHRRESTNLVAQIATIPDVRVVRPELPVELLLCNGPVASNVIAFPSTAAHTLPIVLADTSVVFGVQAIDPAWFTPEASRRMRDFVTRIAADALLLVPPPSG